MKIANARLLGHPLNWLVVWSMLFILFYVGHLLLSHFTGRHPGLPQQANTFEGVAGPGTNTPESVAV